MPYQGISIHGNTYFLKISTQRWSLMEKKHPTISTEQCRQVLVFSPTLEILHLVFQNVFDFLFMLIFQNKVTLRFVPKRKDQTYKLITINQLVY